MAPEPAANELTAIIRRVHESRGHVAVPVGAADKVVAAARRVDKRTRSKLQRVREITAWIARGFPLCPCLHRNKPRHTQRENRKMTCPYYGCPTHLA